MAFCREKNQKLLFKVGSVYRVEKRNRLRWQMKAASLADEGGFVYR